MDAAIQKRRSDRSGPAAGAARATSCALVFQPLIGLKENRITCLEALLRWDQRAGQHLAGRVHPGRRRNRPDRADRRMGAARGLQHAVDLAGRRPRRGQPLGGAVQEQAALRDRGRACSRETGLPPTRLELEITESLLLDDNEHDAADAAPAAGARRPHLDGRFRHRLFVAELPAQRSRSTRSRSTAPSCAT